MAITGTIRAQGLIVGFGTGQEEVDVAWPITNGVPLFRMVTLPANVPTQIPIPPTCTLIIVRPPVDNTIPFQRLALDGLTLAGNCAPTLPQIFSNAGDPNLYLQALGSDLANVEIRCF